MLFARILYKQCSLCKNTSSFYGEVENMSVGKKVVMRSAALILSAVVGIPMIPLMSGKKSLYAGGFVKSMSNTEYGVKGISAPVKPESANSAWKGSYVWFGTYSGAPIKFRVLSPKTTKYGGDTLFLDSEKALYYSKFSDSRDQWASSTLRNTLNGDFLNHSFSDPESNAIALSKYTGGTMYSTDSFEFEAFDETVDVKDKVFLLDADEILNPAYGYYADHGWETKTDWTHCTGNHPVDNHTKKADTGKNARYWLRSYSKWHERQAGVINSNGTMDILLQNSECGVAPALNVSQKFILLSTEVKAADSDGAGAEYKLTILTRLFNIKVSGDQTVEHSGRTIRVPYTISGTESGSVNRVSVIILDRPYAPGNTNGAKMLSYLKLDGAVESSGTGTFTLPSELDMNNWGKKYFVYIIAERENNALYESDYASDPVELYMDKTVRFDFVTSEIDCDSMHDAALAALVEKGLINKIDSSGGLTWYDVNCDGKYDFYSDERVGLYLLIPKVPISGTFVFTEEQLQGTGFTSVAFIFTVEKPGTVAGLKAVSAGKNKVKLTWDPVEGVEGYLIYAQKENKYAYVGMTTKGTAFTDAKALDTDYNFYWVFGYNRDYYNNMIPGGCEKYVYAKGVCLAVTGLKASSVTGGVKLTWNQSSDAEGYLIYGIHPGGSYGYIGMTTQGTTFTDKKASKTDWNFYWVFPYHKNGSTMVVGGTPKYVYGRAK